MTESFVEFTPTVEDSEAICELGQRAYSKDVYMLAAYPRLPNGAENPRVHAMRMGRTGKMLADPRVVCHAIRDDNAIDPATGRKKLIGFAAFIKPKTKDNADTSLPGAEGLPKDMGEYTNMDMLVNVWKEEKEKKEAAMGTEEDYYYVRSLMTDPDYARRGLGTQLMQRGFELADEDQKEMFIEATEAGAPLYRKLGCEEVGEVLAMDSTYRIALFVRRLGGKA